MTVLDFILTGIEAELSLERELGVRSVPCNRAVLIAEEQNPHVAKPSAIGTTASARPIVTPIVPPMRPDAETASNPTQDSCYDFVFLHDRALSANSVAMMAKIIPAMGKTPETAPIVFTGELPRAKVYIVLGGNALKKWFPGMVSAPGQWIQTTTSPHVLVTYSPEYILRFGTVTPAVQKLKREMWTSLKSVLLQIRE